MTLDSEDVATYATATVAIAGAVIIAPVIVAKNITTTVTCNIWKNLKECYTLLTTSKEGIFLHQPLIEHIDQTVLDLVTIGNSSTNNID
ncbi:hypothetical protein [Candidatus Tisiphia endosymbiont of Parasteatoda lunata]|uniref:hypothetical protein n=1 Tax=Candidatus Tisiphia endosymbiont of Parasteatoda lunata TaxID=3066275 RepID=UPI00313DB616